MASSTNHEKKEETNAFNGFKIPKMPKMDNKAMMDSCKKNLEMLGLINKMSMEVCSGIAKLQTAFMQQTITDFGKLTENPGTHSEMMAKMSDLTRDTMVKALGNKQKITDMVTAARNDMTAAASQRLKENIESAKNFGKTAS